MASVQFLFEPGLDDAEADGEADYEADGKADCEADHEMTELDLQRLPTRE